ncbi:DUF6683 family protein [Sphingomonas sp.]|uniref:DUF6683 family protein n=1 Tax=Sphingomonas sp. TaxID=28214 RepID=UPI002FD975BF
MFRIVTVIAMLAAAPASAQEGGWFGLGGFDSAIFNSQANDILRRSHQQIFGESVEESLRRPATSVPRTARPAVAPTVVQRVAAELASGFPPEQRGRAAASFADLYRRYGQLERHLGITAGDPAGGVASLTAASYMAFADSDVSDTAFRALYAQMRRLPAQPAAAGDDAQGRVTIAILATYLAATREALKEQPSAERAAALKAAGGTYLRALLGIDPARVRIGEQGLSLR